MTQNLFEVAIIGGGIVGTATAMALGERCGPSVLVLEAEPRLAAHQSGRNSGVIHSGLYYPPGSLKARLCAEGREALYRFCEKRGVPFRRCGKLVLAVEEAELPALEELARRGEANGLTGLELLDAREVAAREPHAAGAAGLWVPQTGVVDFGRVTTAYAREIERRGGEVRTASRVRRIRRRPDGFELDTAGGSVRCSFLVNCAGLESDRVARLAGVDPKVRILPFRGEYFELCGPNRDLVRGLIYPAPDPELPFLGVHLTRTVDERVTAGPNAVPALSRSGYSRWSVSPRDAFEIAAYPGSWRLARRQWRAALTEASRSLSRRRFTAALRRLVPAISPTDLRSYPSGLRAQAVEPDGRLVDDFRIVAGERAIHLLNAPSPAATASIAIGRYVAERAAAAFE